MTTASARPPLEPHIQGLLSGLRWRIRAYVWLEGLTLAMAWIGLTFWVALAIDYLPVLMGASEMPQAARAVLLVVIAGVLAYILYRWILCRTFVRLRDHSMAVLLERRFDHFQDSLVTAVEMTEHPDHAQEFNRDMLAHTSEEALAQVGYVRLSRVFNFLPLMRNGIVAFALVAPVALFYVLNASALEIWINRLYLLQDQPWPRNAHIEVVGIELMQNPSDSSEVVSSPLIPFSDGDSLKVAKGASVTLHVRADAAAKYVPEVCVIQYRTDEGDRGRVNMKKVGRIKDGYQQYTFDQKPLKGILSSIRFDVVGFDHRVRNHYIEVVDPPAVVKTELDCTFPDYMVDAKLSAGLARKIDWTPGTQLPAGTAITILAQTNKDLKQVRIYNPDTGETATIDVTGEGDARQQFQYHVPRLTQNLSLEITLHDTDNVFSERPHRLMITAVPDEAPRVDVRLYGIGSAVTPDVRVPARGKVIDDYAVNKTWFEVQPPDADPREHEIQLGAGGSVDAAVDFREIRSQPGGFELKPQQKLVLSIKAEDKYNLDGGPNVGSGDVYQLDVVSSEQLLAILEAREAAMRRRFEQIIDEMTESRDSLLRVKADAGSTGAEPEDTASAPASGADPGDKTLDPKAAAERARSLRLLRVQRAFLQSQKSAQEILGVSAAFRDIREELINNRVDSEDRKTRLQNEVVDPLEHIGSVLFPELDSRLQILETKLDDPQAGPPAAAAAVTKANEILIELDKVLQRLIKFETYNELLDIVRALIKEQEDLIGQTKSEQKRQVLNQLE
jgi:hypothetical protein